MIEKLTSVVEVKTLLVSVRCPNNQCDGVLTSDGKQRPVDGLHGGKPQFRHRCEKCEAGYWLGEVYPKVKYEPIETAKVPISVKPVAGATLVPRTET